MEKKKIWCFAVSLVFCMAFVAAGCVQSNKPKVSITNKAELTAVWTEGDADRTVEVSAGDAEVIVSTDNSSVVKVSGMTLTAVGGGSATVTVSDGTSSDSVAITVLPKKTGIEITNKAALVDVWVVGDADRTVEAIYTTTKDDTATEEMTVTSSNSAVIEVNGRILHAKSQGTATITVAGAGFTDTVSISVRPALETLNVTDKDELSAEWAIGTMREMTVAYAPSDSYTTENTVPVVTCEPAGIIEAEGYTLKAVAVGTATVTVTMRDKSDTFNVTVAYGQPEITLSGGYGFTETDEGGMLDGMEGEAFTLPEITAATTDGQDISDSVKIEYPVEMEQVANGKVTFPKGTFTVTYSATDPRDDSKTTTKTLTVNVYRKIFAGSDGSWIASAFASDAEQTAKTTNKGYSYAQFNMEPSTLYYAEVTYTIENPSGSVNVGMGHFKGAGKQDEFLVGCVDRGRDKSDSGADNGQRNHKMGQMRTTGEGAWSLDENSPHTTMLYSYRLVEYRGIKDPNAGQVTYAIARVGDFFYQFVNGQRINIVTFKDYQDVGTIPGVFGTELTASVISDIVFLGGDEAKSKLAEVMKGDGSAISSYAPFGWAKKSLEDNLFTIGETTPEKGVNFTFNNAERDFNDGMVSPWVYFDKDFTFSWEYKNSSVATENTNLQKRMLLEVRDWHFGSEIVQFGQQCGDDSTRRFLLNTPGFADPNKWNEPQKGFDESKGARFTISRTLKENCAEYTMTATSIANPEQTATRTIQWTAENNERWNEPVLVLWHNYGAAGEYSNIVWFAEAMTDADVVAARA